MDAVDNDRKLSADLEALTNLLLDVSVGHVPNRAQSVQYMATREALMRSTANTVLPGFLLQCVSISKFKKFVELYHCDVEQRMHFILAELNAARKLMSRKNAKGWFGDDF